MFDLLMNCTDETKSYDIIKQIKQEDFRQLASMNMGDHMMVNLDERIEANDDPFLAIYTFILENAYEQTHPKIKHRGRTPSGVSLISDKERIVEFYLEKIFSSFSGEKLTKSVTQKLSFLDEFHFGESKSAQNIQEKTDE